MDLVWFFYQFFLWSWLGYSSTTNGRYNSAGQTEHRYVDGKDGALFKIGIDQNSYISVWYYDIGRSNDWILTSRRSTVTAAGNYFLVVKLWDGNNVLVDLPEITEVDDTPTTSVVDAVGVSLFGDATGDLVGGVFTSNADNLDNDGFISDDTIDAAVILSFSGMVMMSKLV